MDTSPKGIKLYFLGARPKTIPAAIAPVLVGTVIGVRPDSISHLKAVNAILALLTSVFLQISVNFANDYSDGVKGADKERVGPLRLVGSGLVPAKRVLLLAIAASFAAALCGLVLAILTSWWLILVGLLSILAGFAYTGGPIPYGYKGFGEIFVLVFFGLVAVGGSAYVQSGSLHLPYLLCGLSIGLYAAAILLANNLRDIKTDRLSKKITLAVMLGDPITRVTWFASLVVANLLVVPISLIEKKPTELLSILAFLVLIKPIKVIMAKGIGKDLIPVLQLTSLAELIFAMLFSTGTFI